MQSISNNILVIPISDKEIFLYIALVLKYSILFTIAFFLTNIFGDQKYLFLIIISSILFIFFYKEVRFGFRAMLERLFKVRYEVNINSDGILLITSIHKKNYKWPDIKKIVPELISDLNDYNVNIITKDARVLRILDDNKWTRFELIKNWSDGAVEIGNVFRHPSGIK